MINDGKLMPTVLIMEVYFQLIAIYQVSRTMMMMMNVMIKVMILINVVHLQLIVVQLYLY